MFLLYGTARSVGCSFAWHMMRGCFICHRRCVKDGHWIRDVGVLIGKR